MYFINLGFHTKNRGIGRFLAVYFRLDKAGSIEQFDLMHLVAIRMPIYPIKAVMAMVSRSPHQLAKSMRPSA